MPSTYDVRQAGCAVCGSTDKPQRRCYNPDCRNLLCMRHALSFEVHDAESTRIEYFCSRRCFGIVQRTRLPASRELTIAFIVGCIVIPLNLIVVNYFIR